MKRSVIKACLATALMLLISCTSVSGIATTRRGQVPAGYKAAASELDRAIASKNRASLDRLIADDFIWVRGSGAKGDKAAFISVLTSESLSIEPFRPEEARWFLTDNSALLSGTNTLRGASGGEPFVDRHRFADHWLWRDGKWRLVYAQVTPISPR